MPEERYSGMKACDLCQHQTDPFTILEPENPSTDKLYVVGKH